MLKLRFNTMGPSIRRLLLLLVFLCLPALSALAAGPANDGDGTHSGTKEWGVLDALGRQAQLELALKRSGQYQALSALPVVNADQGNVSIINEDGTILVPANPFNLNSYTIRITPEGAGYRVKADPTIGFDKTLASAGLPLVLQDDDERNVPLGFNFTFFGQAYSSVFVNSDGNLTFTQGDTATSDRDLSRFLTGVPRIAPFFSDLNPADGGQVTVTSEASRLTVSWDRVPQCCAPPTQPDATFQVSLFADGRITFAYGTSGVQNAVVGVSPGSFFSASKILHFSDSAGTELITLPVAEVFAPNTTLSEAAAARKFYATHDDAYDLLLFFTNFTFDMGNAFAFELNIANDVTGIGLKNFNFSGDFGSSGHMTSAINMGDVRRYPADPSATLFQVFPNSTLSVLGQEAGHRWLVRYRYPYNNDPQSNVLLGRDDAHWSFFFNSDASDMEGNQIVDNGNGTFMTTDVVKRYCAFDQYGMGLIPPEQVPPSFVVVNTDLSDPTRGPRSGVTFSGQRVDVSIDKLIEANGRRLPAAAVAQKNFRFAFVLINGSGTTPPPEQVQVIEAIRSAWEPYWNQITNGRSQADTRLLRGVRLSGLPAAAFPGAQVSAVLRASSTDSVDRTFAIGQSGGAVSVPGTVVVPAGSREAQFKATALTPGISRLTATASGYETAEGYISVAAASQLAVSAVGGDGQLGLPSTQLADPLVVEVRDSFSLPVAGVRVDFTVSGTATVNPASAVTDALGRAKTSVVLGAAGSSTVTAAVSGAPSPITFTVSAIGQAAISPGGAVNGASFSAEMPLAPGSIVSIFGTNLAMSTVEAKSLPLPTKLGNVTVRINDVSAPLYFVSPLQVNAQVPFGLTGTTASVVVNNGASSSTPITAPLAPAAPGIFNVTLGAQTVGAILLHPAYQLVQASNPAHAGEIIAIFCTGIGPLAETIATGQAAPLDHLISTTSTPQVTIGGLSAEVLFSGLAPGFAGLCQVNARIPSAVQPGVQPLVIRTTSGGNTISSNTANLNIQ